MIISNEIFRHYNSSAYFANFSNCNAYHPVRAKFFYQLVYFTHSFYLKPFLIFFQVFLTNH